jgi:hypothetical protein
MMHVTSVSLLASSLVLQFFERLRYYADLSLQRQLELDTRVRRDQERSHEAALASLHLLDSSGGFRGDQPGAEDFCLPAVFLPGAAAGPEKFYTPRAHNFFHALAERGPRTTQPPSIMQLPPLRMPPAGASVPAANLSPKGSGAPVMRTLNLFANARDLAKPAEKSGSDGDGRGP